MRSYFKLIIIAALILCVAPLTLVLSAAKAKKPQQDSASGVTPIAVNVTQVSTSNVPILIKALGTLSAVQVVTISSVADGRINNIYFKDGQQVGKGMPIVQLDNAQAKADYQSAVTALNLARTKYQRSKQLLNTAVSQQELDTLKADVASKDSDVHSKLATLQQKQVDAPISGVLGAFKSHVGDYVSAGDPLVTLVNIKELQINYNVSESILPQLKQGQLVTVGVGAYPHKKFYGTVSFISPTVDRTTRAVAVQAQLPNPNSLLLPGMFVHVAQQVGMTKNALVVPDQSVSADVKGYFVYKVIGNKVAKVYITTGTRQAGQVQILSGLQKGDTVVTAGIQKLEDGSTVSISSIDATVTVAPKPSKNKNTPKPVSYKLGKSSK